MTDPKPAVPGILLDDLRARGLTVAVHNDYRVDGKSHTFWLMTVQHDGMTVALKGEGETDQSALDQIWEQYAKLTEAKAPAAQQLAEARAELERLRTEADRSDEACLEIIDERDRAQDSLSKAHRALGGDGEWSCKVPAEPPPDSGDLHLDVPALAAVIKARAESAEAAHDAATELAASHAAECERVRERLLTAAGDDLCRLSQEEIKAMSLGAVKIPPKEEFLASCERFHSQVAGEAGVMGNCLTLAQLVAECESLRQQLTAANARAEAAEGALAEANNPMHAFADAGWSFHYEALPRIVVASHPLGGEFTVCEVVRFKRGGGENPITFHEVGHAIAAWLNTKAAAELAKGKA